MKGLTIADIYQIDMKIVILNSLYSIKRRSVYHLTILVFIVISIWLLHISLYYTCLV